jgi:opacity protein-like surface antigen
MKRFLLAAVAAAAFTAPAMAADCAKDYKDFWQSLDREKFAKMSAEQIADLSRTALRGYDSCTAGDERFTAKGFYEKLQSQANAKASDIFKDGAFGPAGSPNVKK